jgi:hypothetical protein
MGVNAASREVVTLEPGLGLYRTTFPAGSSGWGESLVSSYLVADLPDNAVYHTVGSAYPLNDAGTLQAETALWAEAAAEVAGSIDDYIDQLEDEEG